MRRTWLLALLCFGACAPDGASTSTQSETGSSEAAGPNRPARSTATLLRFAVFGDARPFFPDDSDDYPSTILQGIFAGAAEHAAQFAIGTGDYMYAFSKHAVQDQVALLQEAEALFSGPIYLAMGNHECNSFSWSNCPKLDETANAHAFAQLLPSGVTKPYYRIDLPTPFGVAKFLFIAGNAWSAEQAKWLAAQLNDPTPYTFAIRHEPPSALAEAPGTKPSEALLEASRYTLEFLGHRHLYQRLDTRHVISGNGGAPMVFSGGTNYGYLLVQQLASGDISVTEIDEATDVELDTWTVTSNGAAQ